MRNPIEKGNWISATLEEMNFLCENNTWELVVALPRTKVIGCKWTFKSKYNSLSSLDKFKARLVSEGFSQNFGTDYDETFEPIVSQTTITIFWQWLYIKIWI